MSISDPIIKQLKVYTIKLTREIETNSIITDRCEYLLPLCTTLEGIFQKGFIGLCWDMLEELSQEMEAGIINKSFSYVRAIESAKTCQKIKTASGRLRLLIRCCLVNKCLHVPVELVVRTYKNHGRQWYDSKCSILGDEILGEIFLSVVLQLSTWHFKLDITNARFLDSTFVLPHCIQVEFVPCSSLGVVVTFIDDKALVVQVDEKGVAAEDNQIQVGDVLDELNGQVIRVETRGKLNSIMSKSKSQPVTVRLIKSLNGSDGSIYSPIISLLKKANLDIFDVKKQILCEKNDHDGPAIIRGGPKVKFIGSIVIGAEGDVKQIEYAVSCILFSKTNIEPTPVYFECQELGLKVISESTGKILFQNSFMEISSCGQTRKHPSYFAYIAGNDCNTMGRKIPGKKHRTVKNPYKQRQKRLESVHLKVNNPPPDADEQEIPKSLLTIMELKNKAKQAVVKKPKRRNKSKRQVVLSVEKFLDKDPVLKGMTKPDKFIPNLIQKPNESAQRFLGRVSLMTQNLINEIEFERKFGVEIKKNSETGEVIEVKNMKKQKSNSKKIKLTEKRKAKLKEKAENLKYEKDFNQLKDSVDFGEVVHRPPTLPTFKSKKNKFEKPRFGSLLLNTVIEASESKVKNIKSNLVKEKLENERKFIVDAYREIKNRKKKQISL